MILSNPPGESYEGELSPGVAHGIYEGLPQPNGTPGYEPEAAPNPLPPTYTLGHLLSAFPTMRDPVIDGLLRQGETMNIIAAPKVGKSWLAAGLAFAVVTGRDWLGFRTQPGEVLLVDNELHPETLASRLRRVAEANDIGMAEVSQGITILPLRGRLKNLHSLGGFFKAQTPGRFRLTIVDAFYRALPMDTDENDNAAVAGLYNTIDLYADYLGSAFVLIHHQSKGDQSQKRVTDVGSGAGSQSRAADTHLILRGHAETNAVVLDAAVRSFPPVASRCLRWDFPSFVQAVDLDPADLHLLGRRQKPKAEAPATPAKPPEPAWTAERFAEVFGPPDPKPRSLVIDAAVTAGLSQRNAERLLGAALDGEFLFEKREPKKGKKITISKLPFARKKPRKTHS